MKFVDVDDDDDFFIQRYIYK